VTLSPETISPDLAKLAAAHGVAVEYKDQLERTVEVSSDSVVAVLRALGVDATTPSAVAAALQAVAQRSATPPVVVMRESQTRAIAVDDVVGLILESGDEAELRMDGGGITLAGLPTGWHTLRTSTRDIPVVVAPDRVTAPVGRHWGLMTQLYAMRSTTSWGIGDLHDLGTLTDWTARAGGGLVLVNPLHATAPLPPLQDSPYYPASRRWTNPIYLRVEDTKEYADAAADVRARVDALRLNDNGDRIDRNRVWEAKLAALTLLFESAPGVGVESLDPALADWATWCALAEVHGPDWRTWPEELRRPDTAAVQQAKSELAERVHFHAWLQLCCDDQLAAVQSRARAAGLSIGVVHDLAVGTDPAGADAWALQDALALDAHIGAPPDTFNQQGQDWGMPPWHPRRLAELGYAPLRDMLRGLLRHAGGVRIDHILGYFRMWWVPADGTARDGTYVSYDAEALLGVLTLEAERAGAIVIGEDLGTLTPDVRRELGGRHVLGTSVLWFERKDPVGGEAGPLRPLAEWREGAAASVTTHDLPTALGWLRGEHVRARGALGVLDDPAAEEKNWQAEREELVELLRASGLVGPDPTEDELVEALTSAVAATPSQVVLVAPGDAVGDLQQPNMPGTTDEYPNWRLPLADETGRPMVLEDVLADPRMERLAASLRRAVR
jgi:4-alpha-glucanotransferase